MRSLSSLKPTACCIDSDPQVVKAMELIPEARDLANKAAWAGGSATIAAYFFGSANTRYSDGPGGGIGGSVTRFG